MKKIVNPFTNKSDWSDYHCFGCSPHNDIGLQLEFWDNETEIIARWSPKKSMEGWTGVLHGGIQAALLDELAAWVVFTKLNTSGVTSALNIKYLTQVYSSRGELTMKGTIVEYKERLAKIKCSLLDGEGKECANGEVTYFCYPENIARKKFHYPGIEAFYEKTQQ